MISTRTPTLVLLNGIQPTLITLHASLLFVLWRLLSETVHVGYDLKELFKNTAFVLLIYNQDYPLDSQ